MHDWWKLVELKMMVKWRGWLCWVFVSSFGLYAGERKMKVGENESRWRDVDGLFPGCWFGIHVGCSGRENKVARGWCWWWRHGLWVRSLVLFIFHLCSGMETWDGGNTTFRFQTSLKSNRLRVIPTQHHVHAKVSKYWCLPLGAPAGGLGFARSSLRSLSPSALVSSPPIFSSSVRKLPPLSFIPSIFEITKNFSRSLPTTLRCYLHAIGWCRSE